MGVCKWCGEKTGLLSRQHKECFARHREVASKLPEFFAKALRNPIEAGRFYELATNLAKSGFIEGEKLRAVAATGLVKMVDEALEDGLITQDEESRVATIAHYFAISSTDDEFRNAAFKLKKAAVLRELEAGRAPAGIEIDGSLGINLGRGEQIIWAFENVTAYKLRTKTHYQGSSAGISFRVMSGVYLRTSAFRGRPVKTQFMSEEGNGFLVITTKGVTFASPMKSFRLPANKIVGIETYSDGVALTRDGANPQPIVFKLDDPWFAANAIAKINQL